MKQSSLLKCVEYVTVAPGNSTGKSDVNPLIDIVIDFEQGSFSLEGSWAYITAPAKNIGQNWHSTNQDTIKIKNELFSTQVIDMDDANFKDALFTMRGTLVDGESVNPSTGLIFLEKQTGDAGNKTPAWMLTIYLFDFAEDETEIKIQLPIYQDTTIAENN